MEWISLKEQLPKFDERILGIREDEPDEPPATTELYKVTQTKLRTTYEWQNEYEPTHWMYIDFLPEPPKQETQ